MNYHKLDTNFIKIFSFFLRVPWHFFSLPYTPRMCFYFFFLSVAVFNFLFFSFISFIGICNPDAMNIGICNAT